jgi:hypothetical protein
MKGAEMSQDAAQRPAVIFLSYRRGDTQWAARGIYDRLVSRYGRENVFRDLDAIPPGARFRDYVEKKISESDVLILLIGTAWAAYKDEAGRRRLEHPRDPVRLEVETALRLAVPIIPVRVEGAPMPTERDLVPSIYDLLEFNAAEVSDSRWDYDLDRLLWAINETVERWRRLSGQAEEQARREAEEQTRREAEAEEIARREAEDKARREAEEKTRREAEDKARREAEEKTRREAEDKARREAEEKTRREAEEKTRRETERRARREVEEHARGHGIEGERRGHPHPPVEGAPTLTIELSPGEDAEQIPVRSWKTARHLLRRRVVWISTAAGIIIAVVLITFFTSARPAILAHLPDELRASCDDATDNAATCHLADGNVVFFRLFDTAAEAETAVTNGADIPPAGPPCPPPAPAANTDVVCRYAVGSENGIAMFGYTAKDQHRIFISRWVSEAEPLLRGEMSTKTAEPADWTTLEEDWTWLAGRS